MSPITNRFEFSNTSNDEYSRLFESVFGTVCNERRLKARDGQRIGSLDLVAFNIYHTCSTKRQMRLGRHFRIPTSLSKNPNSIPLH